MDFSVTNTSAFEDSLALLQQLISIPSFSKEEAGTADLLTQFLKTRGVPISRKGNNVWATSKHWDVSKSVVLLNSHHDTVRPVAAWQRNPFEPTIENGRLYGLGSNDAGGCLVALLATFLHYYEAPDLAFNLIFVASAEEEISGKNGMAAIIAELGKVDLAIVGEPTQMQMAIAEKGLMVIDGIAKGVSGHAAREEGINALYRALDDIAILRKLKLEKKSDLLGPVKISVTQIQAGTQHNVVPDTCHFVVDVRTNECYSNQEVHALMQAAVKSELKPRSFRLNSSGIAPDHPFVRCGLAKGHYYFGSPTLSDQALMPFTSVKIGPGDSARSHTADEYILLSEIEAGIHGYIELLSAYHQEIIFEKMALKNQL